MLCSKSIIKKRGLIKNGGANLVGEETADAEGNVSFLITIPLDSPPGEHTLVLLGQSLDGSERRLTAALKVEIPDTIFQNRFE